MGGITSNLRCKVQIYRREESENELGERQKVLVYFKDAYCSILPASNSEKRTVADTEYNEHSHKFRFRKKSIESIKKDWQFIFEGRKYDIISYDIDFKENEFIDVYARLRQE